AARAGGLARRRDLRIEEQLAAELGQRRIGHRQRRRPLVVTPDGGKLGCGLRGSDRWRGDGGGEQGGCDRALGANTHHNMSSGNACVITTSSGAVIHRSEDSALSYRLGA